MSMTVAMMRIEPWTIFRRFIDRHHIADQAEEVSSSLLAESNRLSDILGALTTEATERHIDPLALLIQRAKSSRFKPHSKR